MRTFRKSSEFTSYRSPPCFVFCAREKPLSRMELKMKSSSAKFKISVPSSVLDPLSVTNEMKGMEISKKEKSGRKFFKTVYDFFGLSLFLLDHRWPTVVMIF